MNNNRKKELQNEGEGILLPFGLDWSRVIPMNNPVGNRKKISLKPCLIAALAILSVLFFLLCFLHAYQAARQIGSGGIEKQEMKQFLEQLPLLFVFLLHLSFSIHLMRLIFRMTVSFYNQPEQPWALLLGIALVIALICGGMALILHFWDMPNRFFPPENILDIPYYLRLPAYWNQPKWDIPIQPEILRITFYGTAAFLFSFVIPLIPRRKNAAIKTLQNHEVQ